ncbi:deoxyribose-phosphate aldolase [Ureaplasma diversum]|uniref:Deoxyribose-phosphate aldolase n=1 Tax=Ureaplasma diversum NCTC 246 TaxID=1188241 RepID=A0A084EYA5_9BACT|nr:deoxyribose-phosphate aldolase [Ureaplasma diversum]KEZ22947.1 Deoxyribose-phosphate aldolase [Ureaplasma diversum NCTC 246]
MNQPISNYIDHTILKANATFEDIYTLCNEAIEYDFFSVCVNPCFVKYAKHLLTNSNPKVCTVIGFPLGANSTETKVFETKNAIQLGADEIDLVINITQLQAFNEEYCLAEIDAVKEVCKDKILKVIVETAYLNEEQKSFAANLILKSKADFIKTSTGFANSGANVDDIILFKSILKDEKLIKASGGIKTLADAQKMINVGADRIGTSSGVSIASKNEG